MKRRVLIVTFCQDVENVVGAGHKDFLKILAYNSFPDVLVKLQLLLRTSRKEIEELLIVL